MKKRSVWKTVGKSLAAVILAVSAVTGMVFKFWKPFGATVPLEAKKEYEQRNPGYYDGAFHTPDNIPLMTGEKSDFDGTDRIAENGLPVKKINEIPRAGEDELKWIWFGHSSSMVQMDGQNILIDPVFGDFASPFQIPVGASKRMSEVPIKPEDLPEIDILLISHDHYDHLDYDTIQKIDKKVLEYIVPLGVENHLVRWGVDPKKITDISWWENTQHGGITITSTPGQHFSSRLPWGRNSTLWCGYVLQDGRRQVYYTGDTGYGSFFDEIQKKFGEVDLMIVENGQYDKMWAYCHMFPEQSVEAAKKMHAKWTVPVHWGTFCICNHPWYESVNQYVRIAGENGINAATPMMGEIVDYAEIETYQDRWYEAYMPAAE